MTISFKGINGFPIFSFLRRNDTETSCRESISSYALSSYRIMRTAVAKIRPEAVHKDSLASEYGNTTGNNVNELLNFISSDTNIGNFSNIDIIDFRLKGDLKDFIKVKFEIREDDSMGSDSNSKFRYRMYATIVRNIMNTLGFILWGGRVPQYKARSIMDSARTGEDNEHSLSSIVFYTYYYLTVLHAPRRMLVFLDNISRLATYIHRWNDSKLGDAEDMLLYEYDGEEHPEENIRRILVDGPRYIENIRGGLVIWYGGDRHKDYAAISTGIKHLVYETLFYNLSRHMSVMDIYNMTKEMYPNRTPSLSSIPRAFEEHKPDVELDIITRIILDHYWRSKK